MPFHSMLLSVRSPFTVSITNLFKPNQKRPHKSKLHEFQQNLHKIDTSQQKRRVIYHLWRCVIIKGLIKCKKVSNVNRFSIAISTALVRALYLALFQSWPRMLMRCGMLSLRSSRGRSTKFSASLMNTCSQVEDRDIWEDGDREAAGHLLEYLGAGGGDDGVGAAVPAHDAPAQPPHLLPVLLHPLPVGRQVIIHCSISI